MNPAIQRIKSRKLLRVFTALSLGTVAVTSLADAATGSYSSTLTSAQSFNWSAITWSGSTPSGAGDIANFTFSADLNVTLNTNVTLARLSNIGTGQFNLLRGTGTNAGVLTMDNGTSLASILFTRNSADATGRRIDANMTLNSDTIVTWGRIQGGARTHGLRGIIGGTGRLSLNYAIAPTEGPDTGTAINLNGGAHVVNVGTALDAVSTYTGGTDLRAGSSDFNTVKFLANKTGAFGTGRIFMHQAALDLSTFNQTVGGLSGGTNSSKISSGSTTAGTTTLTLDFADTANSGNPYTYSGVIMDGSSSSMTGSVRILALTKTGTGTQILSGANTFSGLTSVTGGSLKYGINNALGTGGVTINGGTLDLATFNDSVGAVTLTSGTIKMAANQTGTAQLTSTGAVALGTTNTIDLTGMGTSAGLYKLINGTSLTGTFQTTTGLDSKYKLVYSGTGVDAQHKADQTFTGSAAASRALVGSSVGFSGTLTNTAPTGGSNLAVSIGGLTGASSSAGSSIAAQGTSTITGNIAVGNTAGTVNWSVSNTDANAITTGPSVSGSIQAVNQRSFSTSTGTIALGRFLAGGSPSGSVDVSSSGLNAVTANASLGSFGATNTGGLTLTLSSGSATFNGGAANQTATYSVGGAVTTAGSISGVFSSAVSAEFGSISNVDVNVTGTAVAARTVLGSSTNLGTFHAGKAFNVTSNAYSSSYGTGGTGDYNDTETATVAAISQTDANGVTLTGGLQTLNSAAGFTRTFSGVASIGTGSGSFSSNVTREFSSATTVSANYTIGVYSGLMNWSGGSGSYGTNSNWSDSVAGGAQVAAGLDSEFTGVDTATFNGAGGTVDLDSAAPNLKSITFATGGYTLAQGSGSNSITLSGSGAGISSAAGSNNVNAPIVLGANASLNAGSGSTLTINGNISETGGSRNVTKTGLGTVVLNGTNSYTGTTLVSAGSLVLGTGATLSSSIVTVSSGATFDSGTSGYTVGSGDVLNGTGTVLGSTTIASGGIHAPGNSPGVQTFEDLTYDAGSILAWDLTVPTDPSANFSAIDPVGQTGRGTTWDGVDVTGNLGGSGAIFRIILDGSNDFTNAFWLEGRRWQGIFTAGNSFDLATIFTSFEFYNADGSIAAPVDGEFYWEGNDLVFAIPEPSSAVFGLLIGAGLLRRRRSA